MQTIHHTFGPHVDHSYARQALCLSYMPWRYVKGPMVDRLRGELTVRFQRSAALFSSGRQALLAYLRAIDIEPGDEVVCQGLTCVVVPNAIRAAGGTAIFADIDPMSLNLTAATVERVLTPKTRAVICQHTFGIPADTKALRSLCDARNILLIEDCAHVLPDQSGPSAIGVHGDVLILSFGRDKAISGVSGGAALSKCPRHAAVLRELERSALKDSWRRVAMHLEYAHRMLRIVRPLAGTMFSRPVNVVLRIIGMTVPVLTHQEKHGVMSPILHRLPNACAALALHSLKKLASLNRRRRMATSFFYSVANTDHWHVPSHASNDLPLQKFPVFVENPERIRSSLKSSNMHLDDGWTSAVLCPRSVDATSAGYTEGSCPNAENVAAHLLCLPTHPTMTLFLARKLASALSPLLVSQSKQA